MTLPIIEPNIIINMILEHAVAAGYHSNQSQTTSFKSMNIEHTIVLRCLKVKPMRQHRSGSFNSISLDVFKHAGFC